MPTVTGTLTKWDDEPYTGVVRFEPVPGGVLAGWADVVFYPESDGTFSQTLIAGTYRVHRDDDARYELATVGAGGGDLEDLIVLSSDTVTSTLRLRSPDDGNVYSYQVKLVNGYATLSMIE